MMYFVSLLTCLMLVLAFTNALPTSVAEDGERSLPMATERSHERSRRHVHDEARRQCHRQVYIAFRFILIQIN